MTPGHGNRTRDFQPKGAIDVMTRDMLKFMSLTNTGELRHEEMCAEIQGFSTNKLPLPVTMYVCHGQQGNQMWLLSKAGELKNQATGLCLDSAGLKSGDDAVVTTCSDSPSQMWVWSNYS
ncbi:unnamed protein product [Timema podura]|uniref:Ricin B lectin domain-containing protein n=1 Tax=Timema podura TaxID=61482 RepID=A0ABN7NJI6_TIMPD|nr:unnamed protein product [Timema podura]